MCICGGGGKEGWELFFFCLSGSLSQSLTLYCCVILFSFHLSVYMSDGHIFHIIVKCTARLFFVYVLFYEL